jgi:biotin carboxyl carrier protein
MLSTRSRRMTLPRSRRALTILGVVVLGVLILVRLGLMAARSATLGTADHAPADTPPVIDAPLPLLAAHGVVQPIARATVATLGGGSVAEVGVEVGQVVEKGQILARVAGASQTELVLAPWRGTVTSIAMHTGDTVIPGSPLLTIADPSRYQVETTDVDDYLIARIRPMQQAIVTFVGLNGRTLRGTVVSIASQSQPLPGGGVQYPTLIELSGAAPDVRPGMSVRVVFEE